MKSRKAGKNSPIKEQPGISLYLFAGFILLVLPFFFLSIAIDYTLMPRFLALGIFVLIFGIFYLIRQKNPHPPTQVFRFAIFPVLGLFIVVTIFSMFFSVNVREGFYDLSKAIVFLFLTVLGSFLFIQNDKWQETLAKYAIISAIASSVIGLIQYYIYVSQATTPFLADGRPLIYSVDGVMSHKNLFSLSLLMLMPWIGNGIYILRKSWRWVAIGTMILVFFMIILLQTRAVWMGLLISSIIVFFIYVFIYRGNLLFKRMRMAVLAVTILFIAALAGIVIAGVNDSQNPYIKQFISIADPTSFQNINRIKTWTLTMEMIRDHPLTGVGAGNWQIVSPHYFTGKFSGVEELNWIRPHNDFLWVFSEKGIIGFTLFLAIFGLSFYYLFRIMRQGDSKSQGTALFLIWGLIGYIIASLFDFPYERPFHIAALSLFLSASVALFHRIQPAKPLVVKTLPMVVVFVVSSLFPVIFTFAAVRQEVYVKKSLEDATNRNWNLMLDHTRQATSAFKNLDPWANPISSYYGKAYEELNDLAAAQTAYEEAFKLCPTKLKVLTNLARIYEKKGRYQDAEMMLDKGLTIIPFHKELLKQKCDVYFASGQYKKAYDTYMVIQGWESDSLIVQNLRVLKQELKLNK
jgi:O-antigen ligase